MAFGCSELLVSDTNSIAVNIIVNSVKKTPRNLNGAPFDFAFTKNFNAKNTEIIIGMAINILNIKSGWIGLNYQYKLHIILNKIKLFVLIQGMNTYAKCFSYF